MLKRIITCPFKTIVQWRIQALRVASCLSHHSNTAGYTIIDTILKGVCLQMQSALESRTPDEEVQLNTCSREAQCAMSKASDSLSDITILYHRLIQYPIEI